jgi:hypothetical protein
MLGFPIGYIIIYIYIYTNMFMRMHGSGAGRLGMGGCVWEGGWGGVREGRLVVGAGKRSSRWPFKGWGEES